MCAPAYYEVRDVKNPFMDVANAVDRDAAIAQWNALRETFTSAGVDALEIEAVPDLEDMVYTANQAFVAPEDRFTVPSRMRHASRQREVPYFTAWFREAGFEICKLDFDGEYLEGHGDLLWHPQRRLVWAGYGYRSSCGGVERFATAMRERGIEVVPVELADPTFYHLDTAFAPLGAAAALYYPGAFADDARDALARRWPRLHAVTREEALGFVCNGVVANGRFIASRVPDRIRAVLAQEGLEPLLVDLSEFEKGGGSAFCMKTFIA